VVRKPLPAHPQSGGPAGCKQAQLRARFCVTVRVSVLLYTEFTLPRIYTAPKQALLVGLHCPMKNVQLDSKRLTAALGRCRDRLAAGQHTGRRVGPAASLCVPHT
jgi:hypothetical protein